MELPKTKNPPAKQAAYFKKDHLAAIMACTGLTRLLEAVPPKPQLLVLNYHRIGDASQTQFDPGVYSNDAAGLDKQIRFLKTRYKFATPAQALDIIEGRQVLSETLLLLTFDDGYRDNFVEALPVLESHSVKAIFFVVTSYIENKIVPWWDQIAFLVKRHAPKPLSLTYPQVNTFDLSPEHFNNELRKLLRIFRSPQTLDPERFLTDLEQAVGLRREDIHADLILTWDDARAMQASGMTIGLHTHTHRILSKLPRSEQHQELSLCKSILERELGVEPLFLAYPVGSEHAFNSDTQAVAEEIGLKAAFSFYGGTNLKNNMQRFDIRRVEFENYTPLPRARLAVSLMSATGSKWV